MTIDVSKISGTPEEVEQAFGLNAKTLGLWRHQGKGPRYCKVGRKVLYKFVDVEEFLDRNKVQTKDSIGL